MCRCGRRVSVQDKNKGGLSRRREAPFDGTNGVYPRLPPVLMNERKSLRASSILGVPERPLRCRFETYESKGDTGCRLRIVFKNLCSTISSIILRASIQFLVRANVFYRIYYVAKTTIT